MMSDEGLVDILLVRLGREEEKERVRNLLMKELGFSQEEADDAVSSTPKMIQKAVPMGKGRVIQNRLYPYIDLLPRMDLVDEEPEEEAAPEPAPPAEESSPEPPEEEEEAFEDGDEEEVPGLETAAAAVMEPAENRQAAPEPEADEETPQAEEGEEEERVVVTSASEEMRQVTRCHICGRTPTSGEKLAPCRSCGDLTCRDCFDRVAHVCKKCASDGKYVDKPPQRQQKQKPSEPKPRGAAPQPEASPGGGVSRNLVTGAVAAVLVIALLAVGYFVDPLGLFGATETGRTAQEDPADSSMAAVDTTVAVTDTSSTVPNTTVADTVATQPDSSAADTTRTSPVDTVESSLNLAAATLDSASAAAEPLELRGIRSAGVSGLVVLRDELDLLLPDIGAISASVPIDIDAVTLFRTEEGVTVLALSVLHPEEDTRRYAMLRALGHYLAPTGIDELVFYYRENRYYDARVVPYLNASFEDLSEATGPMEFQDLASCTSAQQWELLNGPVSDWMTSI